MILYKMILFSAVAVMLIIVYYFFVGLADGSITAANRKLWFLILLVTNGIVVGGMLLKHYGHFQWAKVVLAFLAVPGWLYALYILLIMLTKSRWN